LVRQNRWTNLQFANPSHGNCNPPCALIRRATHEAELANEKDFSTIPSTPGSSSLFASSQSLGDDLTGDGSWKQESFGYLATPIFVSFGSSVPSCSRRGIITAYSKATNGSAGVCAPQHQGNSELGYSAYSR